MNIQQQIQELTEASDQLTRIRFSLQQRAQSQSSGYGSEQTRQGYSSQTFGQTPQQPGQIGSGDPVQVRSQVQDVLARLNNLNVNIS